MHFIVSCDLYENERENLFEACKNTSTCGFQVHHRRVFQCIVSPRNGRVEVVVGHSLKRKPESSLPVAPPGGSSRGPYLHQVTDSSPSTTGVAQAMSNKDRKKLQIQLMAFTNFVTPAAEINSIAGP